MSKAVNVDLLFRRIHLFIAEGQQEEALATLVQIQPEGVRQKREVSYLQAWCATLRGQWDEAAQFLRSSDLAEHEIETIQSLGQTERRRRAHYLLLLGSLAINLECYEEATGHYTQCIKFLDERRMNIPGVRIKARCGLGTAYTRTGFHAVALTHYQDALSLIGEDTTHPDLPDIYYGLCDVYRYLGNFEQAFPLGKRALQLYVDGCDRVMEARMRNLLGRICYQMRAFQDASSYYTEALALAASVGDAALIMLNFTGLADARRAEGLLEEAHDYCERALTYQDSISDGRAWGMMYVVYGKVVEAEAGRAHGQLVGELLDQAIVWYKKAEALLLPLRANVELAELYGRLAQILETAGRQGEALAYWKSAYSVYSQPEKVIEV